MHSSDLAIPEAGFSLAQDAFTRQTNERFERLYASVQATASWIDVSLSIPPSRYVGFSGRIYAMMARCLVDLKR